MSCLCSGRSKCFGRRRFLLLLYFFVGFLEFFVGVRTSNQECYAYADCYWDKDCKKQRNFHGNKNELEYGYQNKEECSHQSQEKSPVRLKMLLHCCIAVLCLLADTGLLIKQILAFGCNFFAFVGQLLFKKISFVLCLAYQSKQYGNMLIFCLLHMKLDRLCDIAQ